jgi:hypothetical protein
MPINLTRFYIESLGDGPPTYTETLVEDVETIDADDFESNLKQQNIQYIRVDL